MSKKDELINKLVETYKPNTPDEHAFINQHVVQKTDYVPGYPKMNDIFAGRKTPTYVRSTGTGTERNHKVPGENFAPAGQTVNTRYNNDHGYMPGEDAAVAFPRPNGNLNEKMTPQGGPGLPKKKPSPMRSGPNLTASQGVNLNEDDNLRKEHNKHFDSIDSMAKENGMKLKLNKDEGYKHILSSWHHPTNGTSLFFKSTRHPDVHELDYTKSVDEDGAPQERTIIRSKQGWQNFFYKKSLNELTNVSEDIYGTGLPEPTPGQLPPRKKGSKPPSAWKKTPYRGRIGHDLLASQGITEGLAKGAATSLSQASTATLQSAVKRNPKDPQARAELDNRNTKGGSWQSPIWKTLRGSKPASQGVNEDDHFLRYLHKKNHPQYGNVAGIKIGSHFFSVSKKDGAYGAHYKKIGRHDNDQDIEKEAHKAMYHGPQPKPSTPVQRVAEAWKLSVSKGKPVVDSNNTPKDLLPMFTSGPRTYGRGLGNKKGLDLQTKDANDEFVKRMVKK